MAWASSFDAFFKNFKRESQILSEDNITLIKSYTEKNRLEKALSVIHNALRDIENAPLNIAVTGETGTGKSTFINALRGLGQEDVGAAPTGVTETTWERTPYLHPKLPQVTLWDLPDIGSTFFPPENYLTEMKFGQYDFFIIISATRFKENDVQLAKAITKMKTNFYFVRTKIDIDIDNEQKSKPKTFNKENVLTKIRGDCSRHLQQALSSEPRIFLVSNFDVSDFDFPELQNTLLRELPAHKRHVFMLSLNNVTEEIINRKRDSLKQKVLQDTLKATIPLGGMSMDDIENLDEKFNLCKSYFGLDDASLKNIATKFNTPVNALKAHLRFPHLFTQNDESLEDKLRKYIHHISSGNDGSFATGFYLGKAYYLQNLFIDAVANDAIALLNKEDLLENRVEPYISQPPDYWE